MKAAPKFATEAELCSTFIGHLPKEWTAYAETAGWDILLVHSNGIQVGIQAKLRLNAKVLAQAAEQAWDVDRDGPDYRAVLVPSAANTDLGALAAYCAITVIRCWPPRPWPSSKGSYSPMLPGDAGDTGSDWFPMFPAKRCALPDYVPDVTAGAAAPRTLSRWKVSALRIQALLEETGYVTRQDFGALQIDIRRWIAGGGMAWLQPALGAPVDEVGVPHFRRGSSMPDFGAQHPEVYPQVKADLPKWLPKWRRDGEGAQ
jgi:hypothetical protein